MQHRVKFDVRIKGHKGSLPSKHDCSRIFFLDVDRKETKDKKQVYSCVKLSHLVQVYNLPFPSNISMEGTRSIEEILHDLKLKVLQERGDSKDVVWGKMKGHSAWPVCRGKLVLKYNHCFTFTTTSSYHKETHHTCALNLSTSVL